MRLRKRRSLFGVRRASSLVIPAIFFVLQACGGGGENGGVTPGVDSASPGSSTYSLIVDVDGSGTVTSTPGGIHCEDAGGFCTATYGNGSSVILIAAPADDYEFEGWDASGLNCADASICTVSNADSISMTIVSSTSAVSATRTLRAVFVRKRYALNVSASGSGSVISNPLGISCGTDCTQSYTAGTSVALTATAASGYVFTGWSGNGISCPGAGACSVSMSGARSVIATFSPVAAPVYVLQVSKSGSGTVTSTPTGVACGSDCSESYTSGTSVTLSATAAAGYTFNGWNGGGCSGTGTCTVSMTAARTTTASFVPISYSLNVGVSGSGTVSSSPAGISCGADCVESYASGTTVALTATPAGGYSFSGWSGSGCSGIGACTLAMSAARNVTATFTANNALVVNVSGSGTVTSTPAGINCGVDCRESYIGGTSVMLTATAASGYVFNGWSGACTGTSTTCSVSMIAARDVTASFIANALASRYRVAWTAVTDSEVTGYRVYYSTRAPVDAASAAGVNVGSATSYIFDPVAAGLSIGTTVYFAVAAVGNGQESPLSDAVSVVLQ